MNLPDDDKPVRPPGQRPCMEDGEYDTWDFYNARTATLNRASSPCEDCTLAFSEEMATLGLCDGTPPIVIRSKHRGTSSGERLTRSEAQKLRYSTELDQAKQARVKAHKASWSPQRRARMSELMRQRNLDPNWQARKKGVTCDECRKPVYARGKCLQHYMRLFRKQRKEHT